MKMTRTVLDGPGRALCAGAVVACALSLLGCGDLDGEEGAGVGVGTDPIINGNTVFSDQVGTPWLSLSDPGLSGGCSSTLIRKDWILTAHHCVTQGALTTGGTAIDPANLTAHVLNGPNSPKGVRIVRHPTLDVALVRLEAAPLDSGNRSFTNRLYAASDAGLVNTLVFEQGWGNNVITQCSPSLQGTGGGVLRWANVTIGAMSDSNIYRVPTNSSGQVAFSGDSGSSTFQTVNGWRRPTGVASFINCTQTPLQITDAFFVRSDAFRSWFQGIVGNAPSTGPFSGFERPDQATADLYIDTAGHIKDLTIGGPAGSQWVLGDLTANAGAPAASLSSDLPLYLRNDSLAAVNYATTGSHVVELRLTPTGWRSTDLTTAAGAPNISGGHLSAYIRSDNTNAVLYASTDGHIRELSQPPGSSSWFRGDLTAITGAPNGAGPVGYVRGDPNATNAVVYVDGAGHVQELTLVGSNWFRADLTAITGAPAAIQGAHPYSRSDGYSIVLYRSSNQHIWELALDPTASFWSAADLTAITGCTNAFNDPAPYVRADGINAVPYKGTDSHARELSLTSSGWVCGDMTTAAPGAPNVGVGGPNGYVGADSKTHVSFRASNNHVWDLTLGTSWVATDLTAIAGGP